MTESDDASDGRQALGRGLDNLIPNRGDEATDRLVELGVDAIDRPPEQPRREFDDDELDHLADSIAESGLIQPLVVREADDAYELVAGERRLRASRRAGLDEVPVVVRDVSDAEAYALALAENVQRRDLNPVEEARAYDRLMEEFGFTQAELADHLGKSRSTIANATRLLQLPSPVLDRLAAGELSRGHARALVPLDDDVAEQLAERVADEGLSVRETEKLAQKLADREGDRDDGDSSSSSRYRDDARTRQITEQLQRSLGTKVQLKDRHGEGKVEIHYDDYDVLQSFLDRVLEE